MAILSRSQQLKLIKSPKNAVEIAKALAKKDRSSLHAEAETETQVLAGPGHIRFLQWVRAVLQNEESYARFESLYRPPVPTNELVESIFQEYERVFEAQNSFERFDFSDPELALDFADYRKKIGDLAYWSTQGFETFKTSIDDVLIVDLPKMAEDPDPSASKYPEPYYYTLDLRRVVDIENVKVKSKDAQGNDFYFFKTEYVIFKEFYFVEETKQTFIFVFDDAKFSRFSLPENGEPVWLEDVPHDLGYCPARSFWTTPLNSRSTIQKRGPITNNLSDLDWLLFFAIAERYLQLYAPFPIYAMYKPRCDYKETAGAKRRCIDGYLEIDGARSIGHDRERCPKCATKFRVGPGNIQYFSVPKESTDPDLMANPMRVIPAETNSLDYVRATLKELKKEIFTSCVGRSQDPQNNQAKNEKQIDSSFQSSEAALLKVKRNFEIIKHFALDTVARLRYGADYLGGVVNFGDKFYNKSEGDEVNEYSEAVKNNLPGYELAIRRDEINEARYRNNPKMLERLKILKHLEPYPGITLEGVQKMRKDMPDLVSLNELVIKLNFGAFVDRFEREQADVSLFASAAEFAKKIELIRSELQKYAAEYLAGIVAAKPPAAA
jgi:hypothetical protein